MVFFLEADLPGGRAEDVGRRTRVHQGFRVDEQGN